MVPDNVQGLNGFQLLTSDLWREFKHKLLQQALLTVLEDGDLGEGRQVHADSDFCLELNRQLLQYLVLPRDLTVDVQVLIPAVHAVTQLVADVTVTQVGFDLE